MSKLVKKMGEVKLSLSIVAFAAFFLGSCALQTVQTPQRIDDFVVRAQVESAGYTQDDWKKSIEEYEKLIAEYEENMNSYSAEDKQRVANAVGRYHALLLDSAVKESADSIKAMMQEFADISKLIPAYMEGFSDVFKGDSLKLERLFTDIFASEPVKDMIESITSVFTSIGAGISKSADSVEFVLDTLPEAGPVEQFTE